MADESSKTKVVILTRSYRIKGHIHLHPGARVTDYMIDSKDFMALTDVEVWDLNGRLVMNSPFVNVSRDHIEIVTPEVA
ncbi:MAG TPA: hypothetical protein VK663_09770 [Burkholderiales bacterium]|nr:hypothetical protein [Burkholderiales bacterium]